jgi:hypothetical protein
MNPEVLDERVNPRTTLEYIGNRPSRLTREGRTKFAERALVLAHQNRVQTPGAGEVTSSWTCCLIRMY